MVLSVIALIQGQIIWFPYSIQCAPLLSLVIYIGNLFKRSDILNKLTRNKYIVILVIYLIGLVLGYSNIGYVRAYMKDYILCLIVGLCGSICIIKIAHNNIFNKLGEYIGRDTLYILCAHQITITCLYNTILKLNRYFDNQFIGELVSVIVNVILPIMMTYIWKCVIDKLDKYKINANRKKFENKSLLMSVLLSVVLILPYNAFSKDYINIIVKVSIGSLIIGTTLLISLNINDKSIRKILNITTSIHCMYFLYATLLIWGICGNEVRVFNLDTYSLSRYLTSTFSLFILMYMFVRFVFKLISKEENKNE